MKKSNRLLILMVFGLICYSCDSSECDLDGCSKEGIGWTNNPPSSSLCKGIPCRPMGAENGTGYCSKSHAEKAIWE